MASGTPAASAHPRPNPKEIVDMSTASGSRAEHWPSDMASAGREGLEANWAESTLREVVDSLEDYAHREPLKFAAWVFGIGFVLGWKLKPW
jgi:hypothetical protein